MPTSAIASCWYTDCMGTPAPSGTNPLADDSPRAWQRLIDAVGPASLLVVLESRMGETLRLRTTADDVLQDVFMEAWTRRTTLEWRGVQAFRSWLLTLIDHRLADAADYFAARKRGGAGIGADNSAHLARESDAAAEPVATTTPSRLAMYREQAAIMIAALTAVPEDCREVVRLRLFEELQSQEVASRIGIGESAVRHRFRRGIVVYRKQLERLLSSRTERTSESALAGDPDSAPKGG